MIEVELRGVKKRFGPVEAIKNIDLTVDRGQFCALLGPSGCGKSTLLRMIAGLEVVTEGTIFIAGADVTQVPPAKRRIAMVFQSYALYPHMTVAQNISFSLRVAKAPKDVIQKRTREVGAHAAARGAPRPQAGAALRRPAPARRHRPGPRPRAAGLPLRRAALQPRRHAARADAGRDRQAPPGSRGDDDLRHPRPGRGDDARRQDRRPRPGRHLAGRHADGALPVAGRTSSSPPSSARRR